MKKELDSLATALHVKTDDLPKDSPHLAPWRPVAGIAPQLTDAELVTLAMMQAMLGFTSEAKWLRHARAHRQGECRSFSEDEESRSRVSARRAVSRAPGRPSRPHGPAFTVVRAWTTGPEGTSSVAFRQGAVPLAGAVPGGRPDPRVEIGGER